MKNKNDSSSISFTAHYTGFIWHHYGLSEAAFATTQGRLYYSLLLPFEFLARRVLGSDIKTTLLQRHALIDRELDNMIALHPDLQVLELACGLSPRGHRFTRKYPGITYVEADLPGMVARKKPLLESLHSLNTRHRLTTCNILEKDSRDSIEAVIAREFQHDKALVIISEGLVNYFELPLISAVWQRLTTVLKAFPHGSYLTDIYPEVEGHRFSGIIRAANRSLRIASRSSFMLHFGSDESMRQHFQAQGFAAVSVFNPDHESTVVQARGGALVRVIRASAGAPL